MIDYFSDHLFPCAYKTLFGIDCPVCGFQRAFIMLAHGNFTGSLKMYAPLLPVLILGLIALIGMAKPALVKKSFLSNYSLIVLIIIVINYSIKLATHNY